MFLDPILELELACQRRSEYERAAAIERLILAGQDGHLKLVHYWLVTLGDLLIDAGHRLHEQASQDTDRGIAV